MAFNPVVIVLAAGKGARFRTSGGQVHKLEATLAGKPVLEHVIRAAEASGLTWHVVSHAKGEGMADSIAAGVSATTDADGWLILPADLPLIRPETLLNVAHSLESHSVVVPRFEKQQGHPVGFRKECFEALIGLSGDVGAASVVRQYRLADQVMNLNLDDIGIVTDIDTVDDLIRAEALLREKGGVGV